ncbi:MAG TPA: DUF1735 domain-containing protein [Chitinophagaceae bacterium]|nr:DUF1735 domain-containing protein [Chitinophagaceae bacterium]
MKRKLINTPILFLLLGTALTSCLKDDKYALDPSGSNNVVEFLNVTAPVTGYNDPYVVYVPTTLEAVPEAEFTIGINYAGPEDVAPVDITVQLAEAPEAVTDNNTKKGTTYVHPASSSFQFPATATIKKGEKTALIVVKVQPLELDASVSNAIGLKITSTTRGEVSGNVGKVIYSIPIKSIWQGTYDYQVINDYGTIDANIGGQWNESGVRLETVGPNKLRMTYLWRTYSGYCDYQFNGDNTDLTDIFPFSGTPRVAVIDDVVEVDAVNRIFEVHWTGIGRGVKERFVRTGD